jgi:DNA invertase Pin-like site-specific DNA recombinase
MATDTHTIGSIVFYKLDRLTRSVVDLGNLMQQMQQSNVALVSVMDSIDTESATGRLLTHYQVSAVKDST